jgi:hypothetical protein
VQFRIRRVDADDLEKIQTSFVLLLLPILYGPGEVVDSLSGRTGWLARHPPVSVSCELGATHAFHAPSLAVASTRWFAITGPTRDDAGFLLSRATVSERPLLL